MFLSPRTEPVCGVCLIARTVSVSPSALVVTGGRWHRDVPVITENINTASVSPHQRYVETIYFKRAPYARGFDATSCSFSEPGSLCTFFSVAVAVFLGLLLAHILTKGAKSPPSHPVDGHYGRRADGRWGSNGGCHGVPGRPAGVPIGEFPYLGRAGQGTLEVKEAVIVHCPCLIFCAYIAASFLNGDSCCVIAPENIVEL